MDHHGGDNRQSRRADGSARRGVLRGLAAGAAVIAAGRLGGGETNAKPKKAKQSTCKSCPKICETQNVVFCRPSADPLTEACVCARTSTGGSTCVNIAPALGCSATNQCLRDADRPANQACIRVDDVNCCPPPNDGDPAPTGNLCKPICTPGR